MTFPREILDRIDRVYDYHQATRHTYESVRATGTAEQQKQPSPFRSFPDHPKVALPTTLLDESIPVLSLLSSGRDAIPESQLNPPQQLKTLATWLYMADGLTEKKEQGGATYWLRSCPSPGAAFPYEIYVAAFGIQNLEPGFYHYSPREFCLRKLRDGRETFGQIKRGRPDLDFLRNVPAAILVSTIFCRSAWKFQKRGYRHAVLDAGHLVQNLVTCGTGLGIQTQVRLHMNDNTMRELIGVAPEADFAEAEAVQAMVVWNDPAVQPLALPAAGSAPPPSNGHMAPIARQALSDQCTPYGSILTVHEDCVAPGVAVRDVRPPLTELTPLPDTFPTTEMQLIEDLHGGEMLRSVLLGRKSFPDFVRQSIPRDAFLAINRVALRGGTHFPLFPDGPHVALLRPFWIVHDVIGIDSGAWYYHPTNEKWAMLNPGDFRLEAAYLALEQQTHANASAVCFLFANLHTLLLQGGPDTYRLAHLEAGIVAQRIHLAAAAQEIGCIANGGFYDLEVQKFFGLTSTGWEPIYNVAIGFPYDENNPPIHFSETDEPDWRG